MVLALWGCVSEGGVLLLVEKGDTQGHETIQMARNLILKSYHKTAKVVAPCPHNKACPLPEVSMEKPTCRSDSNSLR